MVVYKKNIVLLIFLILKTVKLKKKNFEEHLK